MRKFTTLLLGLTLCLSNISFVSAAESNEQSPVEQELPIEITVYEEDQGILAPASSSYLSLNQEMAKNKKSYKIKQKGKQQEHRLYQVEDGSELPYTMVLDVKGDQSLFQAVGEMEIDGNNIDQVQEDDRISDTIKSDLDKLMQEIEEKEELDGTTVTLYSPELLAAPGRSWTSPTYWDGEGGYRYKLETLMIDNYVSDSADTFFSSKLDARDFWDKVFSNTVTEIIDGITGTNIVTGIASKVAGIIPFPSAIGGSTGDRIRTWTTEDKNVDYYSININGSYSTKAIGEQSWHRWVANTIINGYNTPYQSQIIYKATPNFTNLAHYAYLYRSSTAQYQERLLRWNYFGNTFKSVN